MEIKTHRSELGIPKQAGTGLLLDIEDPPSALAQRAQSELNLSSPPSPVLLALPPNIFAEASKAEDPVLQAAGEAAMAATELVTTELSKLISPQLGAAVKLGWIVVKGSGWRGSG